MTDRWGEGHGNDGRWRGDWQDWQGWRGDWQGWQGERDWQGCQGWLGWAPPWTPSRSPTERQTLQGSRDNITAVAEKHETAETKRPTDLITAVAAVGGANKIG